MTDPTANQPPVVEDAETDTSGVDLSVLGQLGVRRKEIADAAVLRLPVPGWSEPEIVVLYQPMDPELATKTIREVEHLNEKKKDREVVAKHTDVVIKCCVGVIGRIGDGRDYSLRQGDPHGEPTRFDPDLAEALELEGDNPTARTVVRGLFGKHEAAIMSHATKVLRWSAEIDEEVDAELAGE